MDVKLGKHRLLFGVTVLHTRGRFASHFTGRFRSDPGVKHFPSSVVAGIRCASCRRKLGLKRLRVQGPVREARNETSSLRVYPSSRSKARCAGFDGLSRWLDRDAGGNRAIGVDDRKLFSIFTALEIERLDRLVVGAIDMNHLARI